MEEHEIQFHLEEYRSLKLEVEYRVKSTERIEYLIIVATAAVYVWFTEQAIPPLMWWLPVILPMLGLVRQYGLLLRIMQVTEYIRLVEEKFCIEQLKGWENNLRDLRRSPRGYIIGLSGYFLWLLLFVFTVIIALNGGLSLPNECPPVL